MSDVLTRSIIEREEGWRPEPYRCSLGYPTVGYGFKIGDKGDPLPKFVLPKEAGEAWLQAHVDHIRSELSEELSWMNETRQAIIISMAYQMGIKGALSFGDMWAAIRAGEWEKAAGAMLDSLWARQTPARAHRHVEVMARGKAEGVY